jgi:SH3 domain protein
MAGPSRNKRWRRWYRFSPLFLICMPWATAWAGNLYVSDTALEAVLRKGPGTGNQIISMVPAGTRINLVGEEDKWAEVNLQDGRTGWMLKKYISDQPPWRITAEKLASENKALQAQMAQMTRGKQDLSNETARLKKDLETTQRELLSLRHEHQTLREGAAAYLGLKNSFDKLTADANQVREQLTEAQQGYENLRSSTNIHWFLSGAGVLVLGWLLGLIMARTKRRRVSELYW